MTFYETMQEFSLPIEYGRIDENSEDITPPFLIYMGNPKEVLFADDQRYMNQRVYRLEYYFKNKNEELEDKLENFLEEQGYTFTSSEDIYIESEDLFIIYFEVYTKWQKG